MDGKQGTSSGKNAIESSIDRQRELAPALASKPTPSHPETPGEKQTDNIYDHFDTKSFRFWEREISSGRSPTAPELADLLEANSSGIIPSWLNPIIAQGLRGKLKQRAGRHPATALQDMNLQVAIQLYARYLAWLTKREKCSGLTGWSLIRESAWWVGPPHERAARIVTARRLRHMDWRSFLNLVSSRKLRRPFCE